MDKRKEIIEAASFVKSINEKADVDSVFLVLASKNIKVSKVYVRNILRSGEKPKQEKGLKYKIGRNALKISRIAGELAKDGKEISMENIRGFAKEKLIDIENINYATIVKILEANNFELKKVFNKDKFAERRMEMAALTHEGWTLQMIADKYGITRQAVSLLLKKAAAEGQIVVKSKTKKSDPNEKNVVLVKRIKKSLFVCEQCGQEFYSKTKKKNCSKKCHQKSIEDRSGGEWSRKEFITLTCGTCGKNFERSNYLNRITMIKKGNSTNNYCGRDCYHNKNKTTQCRV